MTWTRPELAILSSNYHTTPHQHPGSRKQHISPPEEPELMANANCDALKRKKHVSFLLISNHRLKKHNVKKNERKSKKLRSSILTKTPIKEMLEQEENQKKELETLKKTDERSQ
ncbi:hypothetical protein TNCV_2605871 [Trichonephila clavipes]|nr:hypothetical protein TNCV_2605871 [Trichonephila clavipes]